MQKLCNENYMNWFFEQLETNQIFRDYYSYILGMYLGDGHIIQAKNKRSYKLTLFNNSFQDKVINLCENSLNYIFPSNRVNVYKVPTCNLIKVYVYNKMIPNVFPQHDFGKNHDRPIKLLDWQLKYLNTSKMLAGLFHSDGTFYTYNGYYFYSFTNCSLDILDICKMCLDDQDIRYTFTSKKASKIVTQSYLIKVYRQKEVMKLYNIVGEKYNKLVHNIDNTKEKFLTN